MPAITGSLALTVTANGGPVVQVAGGLLLLAAGLILALDFRGWATWHAKAAVRYARRFYGPLLNAERRQRLREREARARTTVFDRVTGVLFAAAGVTMLADLFVGL
ncbi:hypothetical protein [Bailinhaonella thermotolerans]|uniref:Uncharacterized protein n=1 Tax=Bailinhaonella thermotolerans TaxID=1070861 RepID=A0A3A4BD98_9ACTN|nr:hypothetical protein [Bailinhaonella thermotolerans]RJL36076.1 hypothetical protein D5H75_04790 [Bailinhaonella thermotolerans]